MGQPTILRIAAVCLLAIFSLAATEDIRGAWRFVMETPGGTRIQNVEFTLEGESVGGTWGRDKVKGTFREGQLRLEFPIYSDEAGATATMIVEGKLEDGKLTGKWQWSQYGGTFVASRPE